MNFNTVSLMIATGCIAAAAHAGGDCLQWSAASPMTASATAAPVAVYDSLRGVCVLVSSDFQTSELINGVWSPGPTLSTGFLGWSPTALPSFAFSTNEGAALLLMGNDVHRYDGFDWTPLADAPFPATYNAAMVYDVARNRFVFFGGESPQLSNQTWEFDGTSWSQINTPDAPPARAHHAMTYDAHRGVVVLFGGRASGGSYLNDTWEYDGANWVDRTPTGPLPPARVRHQLEYHSGLGFAVLHGGQTSGGQTNDLWVWNGNEWQVRFPGGGVPGSSIHAMVYDDGFNVVRRFEFDLMFNLASSGEAPNIAQQPESLSVAFGQPAQFNVVATSSNPLTYQWRFNGVPIPGATNAGYAMASASAEHAGIYDCVIRNAGFGDMSCGAATTIPVTLTVGPACVGDLNGSGEVNAADLALLLGGWGSCD